MLFTEGRGEMHLLLIKKSDQTEKMYFPGLGPEGTKGPWCFC